MVGLGRMGANMTERLQKAGHEVETYARTNPERTTGSLVELASKLDQPRVVWLMIPAGTPTENAFQTLLPLLEDGDIVVDGGNSNFRDSQRRAAEAKKKGVFFLDTGVSGGVWGLKDGYCIMVGGEAEAFAQAEPIFKSLAPKDGYAHVGPSGAGHFVKMVHNGIEYGLMQAYAEGFEILQASEFPLDLPFEPKIVAYLNDYKVQVAKVHGEFVWHSHPETDDFFLVLDGWLTIQLRDGDVELGPGELYIVPRGVEHCPRAEKETHILL